jgi:hypothetical protein
MRQVNPNKASKEKTTIICSNIIKTTHDSFKGTLSNLSHLRQVMLQQKLLAYYQNNIKHDIQKFKPQSKQAPICTTIGMKLFSLFQHQSTFL